MKYWEIIADKLCNAGWSLGWVAAIDSQRQTIWIVDAHGYEKRFIVRADEILTAFLELEMRQNIIDTVDLFATVALALSRVRRLPLEP